MTDSMVTTLEEAAEREARSAEMTPTEVAFARALAVWIGSRAPMDDEPGNALRMLGTGLILDGLALPDRSPTADGRALLDRARKGGVL